MSDIPILNGVHVHAIIISFLCHADLDKKQQKKKVTKQITK